MRIGLSSLLMATALISILGCTTSSSPTPEGLSSQAQPLVAKAKTDLAERLDVSPGEIEVDTVKAVEFSDTSLGVPEPGAMYAQVITPGYIIHLTVGGTQYEYHAGNNRVVFAPQR